jgi:hypothetical protein
MVAYVWPKMKSVVSSKFVAFSTMNICLTW